MAQKKLKKDFDKEKMYQKIMPSVSSSLSDELDGREEPKHAEANQTSSAASLPEKEQKNAAARYILRNFMEDIVLEKLNHTIQMLRGCECERCKKDAVALTLNAMPASYLCVLPSQAEETLRSLRGQCEVKVTAALIKAVQTVKQAPNHDI